MISLPFHSRSGVIRLLSCSLLLSKSLDSVAIQLDCGHQRSFKTFGCTAWRTRAGERTSPSCTLSDSLENARQITAFFTPFQQLRQTRVQCSRGVSFGCLYFRCLPTENSFVDSLCERSLPLSAFCSLFSVFGLCVDE